MNRLSLASAHCAGSKMPDVSLKRAALSNHLRIAGMMLVLSGAFAVSSRADSAVWLGNNRNWFDSSNWSLGRVPDETARFATSGTTSVDISKGTQIGRIQFTANAREHLFSVQEGRLNFTGAGIRSDSGSAQTFDISEPAGINFRNRATITGPKVSLINDKGGLITFFGQSSAGTASILNANTPVSQILFGNNSDAGSADIKNFGGTVYFLEESNAASALIQNGNDVIFSQKSSAGSARIVTADFGAIFLNDEATLANARVSNVTGQLFLQGESSAGSSTIDNFIGFINFNDQSTADKASITNHASLLFQNGATAASASIANDSRVAFQNEASAGAAAIRNSGAVTFNNRATAGTASIENNGGVGFFAESTAGNSKIHNSNRVDFTDNATAGSAQINNKGVMLFALNSSAAQAKIRNLEGGDIVFRDQATLGQAEILNSRSGVGVNFIGQSSAGTGQIANENEGALVFSEQSQAGGARIRNAANSATLFYNDSSAADSTIENDESAQTNFFEQSDAGNSTINNKGGYVSFDGQADAGGATITNTNGGEVEFSGEAQAAGATIQNNNGFIDIVDRTDAIVRIGSLSGAGDVYLGESTVELGALNKDDTISGTIYDDDDFNENEILGSLAKVGTGTLTLQGAQQYRGETTVKSGTLQLAGENSGLRSPTHINRDGTLVIENASSITRDVTNSGRLVLSTQEQPLGKLAVGGAFVSNAGSEIEIGVAGNNASEIGAANAELNGGRVKVQFKPGLYLMRNKIGFLATTDGLTGTFTGIANLREVPEYLRASLLYDAKNAYLLLNRTRTDFAVGLPLSSNARALARSLDAGAANASDALLPIYDSLLVAQNGGQLGGALDETSGDSFASVPIALQNSALRFHADLRSPSLTERNALLAQEAANARRSTPRFAYSGQHFRSLLSAVPTESDATTESAVATGKRGGSRVWGQLGAARDEADSDDNGAGFNASSKEFRVGIDREFNANTVVGIALSKSDGDISSRGLQGDLDSTGIGLYARHESGDVYASAALSFLRHDVESRRSVLGATANADYNARTLTLGGEVGRRLQRGSLVVEPNAHFVLSNTRQDAFAETGAAAALRVGAESVVSRRVGIGVRVTGGNSRVRPHLAVNYDREFGDRRAELSNQLTGLNAFRVRSTQLGRNIFSVRGGAEVAVGPRISLSGEIGGALRKNASSRFISGSVRYNF